MADKQTVIRYSILLPLKIDVNVMSFSSPRNDLFISQKKKILWLSRQGEVCLTTGCDYLRKSWCCSAVNLLSSLLHNGSIKIRPCLRPFTAAVGHAIQLVDRRCEVQKSVQEFLFERKSGKLSWTMRGISTETLSLALCFPVIIVTSHHICF